MELRTCQFPPIVASSARGDLDNVLSLPGACCAGPCPHRPACIPSASVLLDLRDFPALMPRNLAHQALSSSFSGFAALWVEEGASDLTPLSSLSRRRRGDELIGP